MPLWRVNQVQTRTNVKKIYIANESDDVHFKVYAAIEMDDLWVSEMCAEMYETQQNLHNKWKYLS